MQMTVEKERAAVGSCSECGTWRVSSSITSMQPVQLCAVTQGETMVIRSADMTE